MSTITGETSTARGNAGLPELSGLTFAGIIRSEWIKLRSLRSTIWCYGIIVLITVGLGLVYSAFVGSSGAAGSGFDDSIVVQASTFSISMTQLVAAVLGVLVITGEYGTGMIRSTLTAVPKRIPALVAKGLVFGVTTFVVGFVSIAATALITAPLLSGAGVSVDLTDSSVLLPLLGGAGYLTLIGLLSFTIGAVIRNSAGGIAASLGLILVVPTILAVFAMLAQAEWLSKLAAFLPSAAGERMFAYYDGSELPEGTLGQAAGMGVLALWVVVVFALAAVLLKRRDA